MEYNQPSEIVKDLNFGDTAKNRIAAGVEKLAKAAENRAKRKAIFDAAKAERKAKRDAKKNKK